MEQIKGHDVRWWVKTLLEGAIIAACLWFCLTAHGQDNVHIAVLESRTDQIDAHLHATDDTVQRLWSTVQSEQNAISEMQGEERIAWGVIGLLSSGSLVLQFKKRV